MKETQDKHNRKREPAESQAQDPQKDSSVFQGLKGFAEPELQEVRISEEQLKYRVYQWLRQHSKEKRYGILKKCAATLGLNYEEKKQSLWQISSDFKHDVRFGVAPKSSPERHSVNLRAYAPKCLDRVTYPEIEDQAVAAGWIRNKNRNRELIWANDLMLGRVRWWRTGKVLAHIEKPQTVDRRNKLLATAFGATGLINDKNILVSFIQSFDMFQWHDVHRTPDGSKLPYMTIDDYVELLGFRIKVGDLSHRDAVELEFLKPEWMERSQRTLERDTKAFEINSKIIDQNSQKIQQFNDLMRDLSQPKPKPAQDRSVV